MAFWTSSNPGVLPKWVFWLLAVWTPIDLVLTVAEAVDTDSSPKLFGVFVMGWCAWLAHKNEVRALVWVNAIAATLSFVVAFFWTNVTQLPRELVPTGYEYVTSSYFVFVGVVSLIFALYLNRYTVKRVAPQLDKLDRRSATAKSYAPSSAPIKGAEQDEEQLAERGILDVQRDETPEEASPDDYAIELSLFESGDLEQSLWAKHLVEAEGDADKAKWRYIKARVNTAPARRAEQEKEKKEAEMRAFVEAERLKEERLAAERKAAFEAIHRRIELEVAQEEAAKEAERQRIELEMAEREIAAKAERDALRKRRIEARRRRIAAAWNVFSDTLVLANTNRGWSATVVLVFVVGPLIFFNLLPEEETRAANLINESWRNFVGDRGVVDEELAISQIETALSLIADRSTPEATELRGYAYNNLGVYRACAADQKFRDKKASKQAYRRVIDTNHYFMQRALWSVFWGDLPADTINTPAQYNLLTDLMRDWAAPIEFRELYPEKTPLEVLKLMDEKRSELPLPEHIAAQQIAFYFECRAESQDIGLAIEWYQTALERFSVTPEPIVSSPDLPLDQELERVLTDLSLTAWELDKQTVNERLIRLQQVVADYRR